MSPRSANGKVEVQHSHTGCRSHTRMDKGECGGQEREAQRGRGGSKHNRNRGPKSEGWESMCLGGNHLT